METKRRSIITKQALTAMVMMIILCAAALLGFLQVFAVSAEGEGDPVEDERLFVGRSRYLSDEDLYNATNTYRYNGNSYEYIPELPTDQNSDEQWTAIHEKYYNYRTFNEYYDVSPSGQLNNGDVMELPQITVLTHGFGGDASHWSNNSMEVEWAPGIGFEFAYTPDSLITRLDEELLGGEASIYWAEMKNHNSFYLTDLKNPKNTNADNVYERKETIKEIPASFKHIILVFYDVEIKQNSAPDRRGFSVGAFSLAEIIYAPLKIF